MDVPIVRFDETHGAQSTSQTEPAVVVWCHGEPRA